MNERAKAALVDRVRAGQSMQSVADDLGISRERVRQIAKEFGVTGASVRYERKQREMAQSAREIVVTREQWASPMFSKRPFTQEEFEDFLDAECPELAERWYAAITLPLSKSGNAHPDGQRCSDCGKWFEWSEFGSDKSRRVGKASRCKKCAKKNADETRRKRKVLEPTVKEKLCRRCGRSLSASGFYRSTTSPTGLQQYCKTCRAEYERMRRQNV